MTSMYDMTSAEVAAAIARNPLAIIPFGSVEQHGPHLPCGTDTMTAELVAKTVAAKTDGLFVPFAPYGVTPIHAGHPGTITLRRGTFEALLRDVCSELITMGVRTVVFVNWHEVNSASLDAVATELQDETEANFVMAQACYVAQRLYAGEGGKLTHGGSIETMAVMAHDPSLVKLEGVTEATRPSGAEDLDAMRRSHEVYGFVTDVTEVADDGWYGDPWWATDDLADDFAERVAGAIVERLAEIERLRGGGR
ncbi:MAG: creatininase family protein [Actinobacteria bacterium]|nr:creatininase family protein [Actinomycetota bacterium]